jgi:hypothetical protein
MKNFVILSVILIMGGCASTDGNVNHKWDKAFWNSDDKTGLYKGYNPNFNNYQEVSFEEANLEMEANKGNNIDKYFVTKNVVFRGVANLNFKPFAINISDLDELKMAGITGKATIYTVNIMGYPSTLPEQNSIVTIWYRGIWRVKDNYSSGHFFLDKIEVTGQFVQEATAEEIAEANRRAERAAERQQPQFSPEGQEYIKRNLIQAVGESKNQANRGKTLFFESIVTIREGILTGQYLVSATGSDSIVIMEFYDRIPPDAVFNSVTTILYRVEVSQWGETKFTIDSFRRFF